MPAISFRLKYVVAVLVITNLFIVYHRYVISKLQPKLNFELPLIVGDWKGEEESVSIKSYQILEADTVLARTYSNEDKLIGFSAVFYSDNQVGFHKPESCSGGIGRKVFKEGVVEIFLNKLGKTIKVNQLKIRGQKGEGILLYFYKVGNYFSESYLKVRIRMLLDQLQFKAFDVCLFQIYSPVNFKNDESARTDLNHFLNDLAPYL